MAPTPVAPRPIAPAVVPPRPAADAIATGRAIDREFTAPEIHRYRVTAGASTVITGVVEQDGIDLEVITYDATGAKIKTFDSPNGEHGPEPFTIEVTAPGDYDFEVRQVELPPDAQDVTRSPHGKYHATVDVMPADDYAYKLAQQHIASPRILTLWRDVRLHHHDAVDKFWADFKGPIVEPYPGHPESAQLKEQRHVGVYLPAGYDPKQRYPLLIVFDGEVYGLAPKPQVPRRRSSTT
jgi:hypothetical protein